jgi:hypothetical protein
MRETRPSIYLILKIAIRNANRSVGSFHESTKKERRNCRAQHFSGEISPSKPRTCRFQDVSLLKITANFLDVEEFLSFSRIRQYRNLDYTVVEVRVGSNRSSGTSSVSLTFYHVPFNHIYIYIYIYIYVPGYIYIYPGTIVWLRIVPTFAVYC